SNATSSARSTTSSDPPQRHPVQSVDSYRSVNALAENLWMVIKTECIRGRVFATRAEANLALFEYLDSFYNPRRIQKRLGYLSPIEYEEKHYANQAATERANLKPRQPTLTS
ncbi:IS3 family transposase, partial [Streptomyces sp. NPDC097981]|uniref:IS3 family transposase n=1 Tax=Streptomyces sp. NPDC097981 TaxID=3155428 RepID=UPI003333FC21